MKKKVIALFGIALFSSGCTSLFWRVSEKEEKADVALLKFSEELELEENLRGQKASIETATIVETNKQTEEVKLEKTLQTRKKITSLKTEENKQESKKENSKKIEVAVTQRKILFVGDSVMKGSEAQLRKIFPNAIVDSAVSRQFSALPDILHRVEKTQGIPDVVVVHLGSNGNIFEKHMLESMEILGNRKVFFINCKVERPWQESVNHFLKTQVAKYKNTKLVDWYSLAHDQNQYFAKDRIHPNQMGAKVYRAMILEKLEKEL